ncbi:hypothetical protein [Xanthomonas phaseoli]|uniref:hypothetical protein n=1 Tax=Xanthomonas phaseoli TaxID=1985254 RepID=UPI001FD6227D|nr:hypothetical protein [Xanthomonas phaseoli]
MPRFFVCDVSYQSVLAPGAVPGKRFKMRHIEGLLQETAMHLRRPDQAAGAGCLMTLRAIATSSIDALGSLVTAFDAHGNVEKPGGYVALSTPDSLD